MAKMSSINKNKKRNKPRLINVSDLSFLKSLNKPKSPYAVKVAPSIDDNALNKLMLPLSIIWFEKKVKICSPSLGVS